MSTVNPLIADAQRIFRDLLANLDNVPSGSLDDLAETVLALDDLRVNLAAVRDAYEQRLVGEMDDLPEITVEGAILQKRRSDSRKAWDHKVLATDLAERLVQMSFDMETGEVLKSPEELIREVLDYAGVSYWKVKALSGVGIVADDYCEVTEGPLKIRIQRLDA
jgi:hypothetical protein